MRFRLKLLILSSSVLSLLGGCAVTPTSTESKHQSIETAVDREPLSQSNEHYNERITQVSRDVRAICTSPANRLYYAKTPCLPAGMTEAHLKDRSRITPDAKRVAERVFESLHKINEDTRDLMMSTGNPRLIELAQHSREVVDPKIEAIQSSLLKGAMTWGEYNRARLEVYESSKESAPGE